MRLALLFLLCIAWLSAMSETRNGFDLSDSLIPADEIVQTSVPRDGIPALDTPTFLKASEARHMRGKERVIGVVINGEARAYPVRILNYHEVVNDVIGGRSLTVTYCPLCGTGVIFDVTGQPWQRFGVSGLLYNSDVLLYDRETGSLWSQMLAKAVTGPARGVGLFPVSVTHTRWGEWLDRHPDTLVLSPDTGYRRDYQENPYETYAEIADLWFPVAHRDRRLKAKERVIGLELDGVYKAYPFSQLSRRTNRISDRFGDQSLTVEYDRSAESGRVLDEQGNEIVTFTAYWFAWAAFHPETEVFMKP